MCGAYPLTLMMRGLIRGWDLEDMLDMKAAYNLTAGLEKSYHNGDAAYHSSYHAADSA